jgi:hypothetical protein
MIELSMKVDESSPFCFESSVISYQFSVISKKSKKSEKSEKLKVISYQLSDFSKKSEELKVES